MPAASRLNDRHDQIRVQALELFARRGFAPVGMRELAAHLGMTSGSIYHHIENKQALLYELIEDLYQTLLNDPRRKAGSAELRLQRLLDRHIELHASLALQFLMAEREVHQLEPAHLAGVVALRTQYEHRLLALLAEVAQIPVSPALRAFAASCVSLLNNLPLWLQQHLPQSHVQAAMSSVLVRNYMTNALLAFKV